MTFENYEYRTDPMFLRGQYIGNNEWTMPEIPKCVLSQKELNDLRLIGYDRVKSGKDRHFNRMVHFFLYDYKFEDIWENPEKRLEMLSKYRAVLTPDFSMYTQMHPLLQLHNTFRNRWIGAYLADNGIKVLPTVSWSDSLSFDFCFDGIAKGSAVAVSTYMVSEHYNRRDQKALFLKGYNEMLRRIDPEIILCYNEPFLEMGGNVHYIDYELSSWKHENDDIKESDNPLFDKLLRSWDKYIIKGMGSAYGGKWRPSPNKPSDKRFLGNPGDINQDTNDGYLKETLIGKDGRAIRERHHSTCPNPKSHTNPHDHVINWNPDRGNPSLGSVINYSDGKAPDLNSFYDGVEKSLSNILLYEYERRHRSMGIIIDSNPPGSNQFKTISEFKWCLHDGGEVVFIWNNKTYGIAPKLKQTPESDPRMLISQIFIENQEETEKWCDSADDVLDYLIDGVKLREIITQVEVIDRTL